MNKYRKALSAWGPALVYMAVIFVLSAQEGLPHPPWIFSFDKLQHALVYMVLGLLVLRAVFMVPLFRCCLYLQAGVISALYGVFDELHQGMVPHRFADAMDVVADVVGIAVGLAIVYVMRKRAEKGVNSSV